MCIRQLYVNFLIQLQMTVGETLYFAARARQHRFIPNGTTKQSYAEFMRDVMMASQYIHRSFRCIADAN